MSESQEHEHKQLEDFKMKIQRFQRENANDKTLFDINPTDLGAQEMQVWKTYFALLKKMSEMSKEDLVNEEKLDAMLEQLETLNTSTLQENTPFYLWIRNRLTAPRSNFQVLKQYKSDEDAQEIKKELEQERKQFQ